MRSKDSCLNLLKTNTWEQHELGKCLELLKDGTHGSHKDSSSGYYLLSAKNIKNGKVNYDDTDRIISQSDFDDIHKGYKLQKGDVLMTIVGTIGETAIVDEENKYTFQRSVAILRPNCTLDRLFLVSTIEANSFQDQLRKKQSFSAQSGIYLGDLGEVVISLPQYDEQCLIGEVFSSLDSLLTLHQRKAS